MNTRSSPHRADRPAKTCKEASPTPTSPTSQKRKYEEEISTAQEQLLRDPKFYDLTIVCGDRTWNCQRSILSQRCAFFRAACTGQFEESETRRIELKEDYPEAIDIVLLHLYTLRVPDLTDETLFPGRGTIVRQLWKTADTYDISPLRTAAKEYFIKKLKFTFATWPIDPEGKKTVVAYIRMMWEWDMQGSDEVRQVVVQGLTKTAKLAIEDIGFQDLLRTNKDLSFALIRGLAGQGKHR